MRAEGTGQDTAASQRTRYLEIVRGGENKAARILAAKKLRRVGDAGTFAALSDLVRAREFKQRDEEEINVVLETLTRLGGVRSARVLEELESRRSLVMREKTKMISRAANNWLTALRDDQRREQQKTPAGQCPRCRFQNIPQAQRCLSCGCMLTSKGVRFSASKTVKLNRANLRERKLVRDATPQARAKQVARRDPEPAPPASEPLPPPVTNFLFTEVEARGAIAWLNCAPFDPLPVGTKPLLKLGRQRTCDLVLPHESVSRHHAALRVLGGEMVLEDLSNYGTYVNGKRVLSCTLKAGDVLTVGPYDIHVDGTRREPPKQDEAATKPLRTFKSTEAIGGRLERVALSEVLQQLEFNEKTGTLKVFTDTEDGSLVIHEGRPFLAELGELRGEEAVFAMLGLQRGKFSFRSKVEPGERTMHTTITSLLLENSRRSDEGS